MSQINFLQTNKLLVFGFFLVLFFQTSCQNNDETTKDLDTQLTETLQKVSPNGMGAYHFKMPSGTDLDLIPQDPRNPINSFKVALGKLLFHETAIGSAPKVGTGMQTYSCASCHHAKGGFQACLAQGIGEGGVAFGQTGELREIDPNYPIDSIDVQPIRSPSAMNGAWQKVMLWNGQFGAVGMNVGTEASWTANTPKANNHLGFEGLETQAIAGQKVHRLKIDPIWVKSQPLYKYLFDNAFPEVAEADRYTRITAGLAIAAYERTMMSNESPWQNWLNGDETALTDEEKKGAVLFFGKGACGDCHSGPALNSMAFHGYGMSDLLTGNYGAILAGADKPEHKGRGGFTGNPEDLYKFKVPQLYNLKDSPFYGHGASFQSIRSVVEYKNAGVPQNANVPASQLAPQFKALNLTEEEISAITIFIEHGLYDPNLSRYVPEKLPSGLCFPNNDVQARVDQGCD